MMRHAHRSWFNPKECWERKRSAWEPQHLRARQTRYTHVITGNSELVLNARLARARADIGRLVGWADLGWLI